MGKGLIAIALTVLALVACKHDADPYKKPLVAVRVRLMEPASGQAATRYSANVEAFARVDLAFKVGGYVREIAQLRSDGVRRTMQEGDDVRRGQVLARLREGDYLQKVAGAKAHLAEANAMAEQAKLESDRATKLVDLQVVARAQLDDAKARLDAASARVEAARAQLQEAENAVEDTAITSPIDGMVMKRGIEVGSLAVPGSLAFIVADTRQVKVVFGVSDAIVEKLQLGSSVTITTQARAGMEYTGKISRVSPSADPKSRVFEVEATIANRKQELRVGMVAALKVPEAKAAPTPGGAASVPVQPSAVGVVPLNAVIRSPSDPNGFAVFVVADEGGRTVAHVKLVGLGDPLGNRILVAEGLAPGDRVIVMGATIVADGEEVRVIP
jgi:RND family efflux transporter MFP subunit